MTPQGAFQHISKEMNAAIIGQEEVVERLLIAFLANGHVLMEGLPGVAKTRSIKTLGKLIESEFSRVQFT
ncbi:MAG: MoxR family ATPase, partial [Verrucomicrobiota bacterium]